jgi:outer membrane receptor protein involved in Fe transport
MGLEGLELGIYVKNVLDNKAKYPSQDNGGYIVNRGRTYGLGVRYKI